MKKNKIIKTFMCLYLVMFSFKTIVLGLNENSGELKCDSWGAVLTDIQNLFNFLKIIVPLLVIGLSTYDFIKAAGAKEEKGMKRAFNTFLKRIILAVVFFFLPVLINLLLNMLDINSSVCVE